ncbi:uncharacterized protein LOC119452450 isoform X2 [Dermacentor silvarum]|uniref:uncharacterized protein LOC119452450 isoform X2 n=1 Tax=Dermacentor silvarum TaxID=543639 RepID=UPI0021012B43|nr:uncharacterized protein LOC119452450 isoform X2 [Dermacentor silvarum]
MRPFWYLVFFVGIVTSGDPSTNDVPGCGDAQPGSKEITTSTPTTAKETTSSTTTTEGAREEDEKKYGYYRDRNGCVHKVLQSYQLMYDADCTYYCPYYPFRYKVPNRTPCLMLLENRLQERQYASSKVCRKGYCVYGTCVPTGYVQRCTVPQNGPRVSRLPPKNNYE